MHIFYHEKHFQLHFSNKFRKTEYYNDNQNLKKRTIIILAPIKIKFVFEK